MLIRFKFEEGDPEWRIIPVAVRMKAEVAGAPLRQELWDRLTPGERAALGHLPAKTRAEKACFKKWVVDLCRREGLECPEPMPPHPPGRGEWADPRRIPEAVYRCSARCGVPIYTQDWILMDDLERYCLFLLALGMDQNARISDAYSEIVERVRPKNTIMSL